jgi:hypothetical protein
MTVLMMMYGPVPQQLEPKVDWVGQGQIVQEYIGNWSKNPRIIIDDDDDDDDDDVDVEKHHREEIPKHPH